MDTKHPIDQLTNEQLGNVVANAISEDVFEDNEQEIGEIIRAGSLLCLHDETLGKVIKAAIDNEVIDPSLLFVATK